VRIWAPFKFEPDPTTFRGILLLYKFIYYSQIANSYKKKNLVKNHFLTQILSLSFFLLDEPSVLGLLDRSRHPFPKKPARFVRAQLYTYHFTSEADAAASSSSSEGKPKNWWSRELKGDYLPPVSLDTPGRTRFTKF
jgi:hypothetical protein